MFGRSVTIDGKEYFVMCTPKTPLSEVLESAARMARREESAVHFENYHNRTNRVHR